MAVNAFRVYIGSVLVGTMLDANLSIKGNDGQQLTVEGCVYSNGVVTTDLDVNTIVATEGKTQRILQAMLNKEDVNVQIGIVDGQIVSVTMRPLEAGYKCTVKDGSVMGNFKFGGGKPTLV